MPGCPRREIIDESKVGLYHVRARCVRGIFLCGWDKASGKDFDYRRKWIRDRISYLATAFAIDIAYYDLMNNHIHLELRNRPDLVATWSDAEVIRRACLIHAPKFAECGVVDGMPTKKQVATLVQNKKLVATYRKRLSSISWMMRGLCQYIATKANREEEKESNGTFWNGRFGCSRIIDEAGVLLCGVYIDLNQVRAGMVPTPELSRFSSVFDRIRGLRARSNSATAAAACEHDGWLSPLSHNGDGQAGYPTTMRASSKGVLDMPLEEYLKLLDWTGRQLHAGKRGKIDDTLPPILDRIGFSGEGWLNCLRDFKQIFKTVIGFGVSMRAYASEKGKRCVHGSNLVDRACQAGSTG